MSTLSEVVPPSAFEAESRFLFPFTFAGHLYEAAYDELLALRYAGSGQDARQIWHTTTGTDLYTRDLLPSVSDFLFGSNVCSCHALVVDPPVVQSWFRNGVLALGPRSNVPYALVSVAPENGIELFLSPFGAATLSIRLTCRPIEPDKTLDYAFIAQSNYLLSLLGKGRTSLLAIPGPYRETERLLIEGPLVERLGRTGAAISLAEFIEFLLGPVQQFDMRPLQRQLSVYTVVRFGSDCDLSDPKVRHALAPFLGGLAQLEEATHASGIPGETGVPDLILNSCHWAAASSMGAAHLIADQSADGSEPKHPFDQQRLGVVCHRYFTAYLLALLQRIALQRFIIRANSLMPFDDCNPEFLKNFRVLRESVLTFTVHASNRAISSRDALNRFYELSARALGLHQMAVDTREVIEHVDECREAIQHAALASRQEDMAQSLRENVNRLTNMQEEVGILELFFVAVYATELAKMIAESADLAAWYVATTACLWGLLAAGIAALALKRLHTEGKGRWKVIAVVLLVMGLLIGWIGLGRRLAPLHQVGDAHSETVTGATSIPGSK
jgi:hypothetical protein